ncbi:MAG: lipid A deacylase LpxR family protein [Rhodospirillales bacterium]|nr:lipid A deacylase LpxR family protein [Rhodospirillales bacterium]
MAAMVAESPSSRHNWPRYCYHDFHAPPCFRSRPCRGGVRACPRDFAGGDAGGGNWTLMMENDRFSDTDRHYTHGTRLAWVSNEKGDEAGWIKDRLNQLYPFAYMREGRIGFALGQNIYTPEDTSRHELTVTDRPYAGWLYGAASVHAETGQNVFGQPLDILDTVELQIGVIGPASLAEPTQKMFHRLIDTTRPQGWGHQLDTEPGIALLAERKWRTPETKLGAGAIAVDLIPHVGGALGNVYTHVSAGAMARIRRNLRFDYGPPQIQPALSGLEAIDSPGEFGWYLFAGVAGRAVGRNIFLDGNTFSDSHNVDKHTLVGDFKVGAALVSGHWRLAFSHVIRTREFEGQDKADRFAAVSLSVRY